MRGPYGLRIDQSQHAKSVTHIINFGYCTRSSSGQLFISQCNIVFSVVHGQVCFKCSFVCYYISFLPAGQDRGQFDSRTTLELRFSSREQYHKVEASWEKIQQCNENLARSLDFRLLFVSESQSAIRKCSILRICAFGLHEWRITTAHTHKTNNYVNNVLRTFEAKILKEFDNRSASAQNQTLFIQKSI